MSGFGDMMMDDGFSDPMEYMDYLEEQYYNSQSVYDDCWLDVYSTKEAKKEVDKKPLIPKFETRNESDAIGDSPF